MKTKYGGFNRLYDPAGTTPAKDGCWKEKEAKKNSKVEKGDNKKVTKPSRKNQPGSKRHIQLNDHNSP